MANYNERLSFKIPHTPIWASMAVFEDTEKALIKHPYEFKTSMKRPYTFVAVRNQQAFTPDGIPVSTSCNCCALFWPMPRHPNRISCLNLSANGSMGLQISGDS